MAIKKQNKTFKKQCYIEVTTKRKEIIVELFLTDNYCGQPIKRFIFKNTDEFTLKNLYVDVLVEDYENCYS